MHKSSFWPGIVIKTGDKTFILCVCHHHANRSFNVFGIGNYVCSRCLGILIGGVFGFFSIILGFFFNTLILIILLIPLIIDGTYQMYCDYESTNYKRFITGWFWLLNFVSIIYINHIFLKIEVSGLI